VIDENEPGPHAIHERHKFPTGYGDALASSKMTTIHLRMETKELLRKIGSKDQTYDQRIRELIDRASIRKRETRWNRILEKEEFVPLEKR